MDSERITSVDTQYTVSISATNNYDSMTLCDSDGNDATAKTGLYILKGNTKSEHSMTLSIPSGYESGTQVIVTAMSHKPFAKTLTFVFNLSTFSLNQTYEVIDDVGNRYAQLLIRTDREFTPVIDWTSPLAFDKLQVDCTNELLLKRDGNGDVISPLSLGDDVSENLKNNKITATRNLKKQESVSIFFFKTNVNDNFMQAELTIGDKGDFITVSNMN